VTADAPAILARGPWALDQVDAVWRADEFDPGAAAGEQADAAVAALRERGSPSQDGLAARLAGFAATPERLRLELQPSRWALRLVPGDANGAVSALCAVRDSEGRWLAGRRAAWLASWAGRWALGAGGAVDLGESPAHTLVRELDEEWGVAPERATVEALVRLPHGMVMLIGLAWLAPGAEVRRDPEHDDHAWWPPDPAAWPPEADAPLRRMATLLGASVSERFAEPPEERPVSGEA
jgi:ADP-ribose pyrophosphatase YjhB (NUDIX family)